MQPPTLQPVAIQERIQTIDIIRGFALVGILIINFTVDAGQTEPWTGFNGFIDQLVYWPVAFFMNDKFVAIYCFLFGLGFSIQMLRAEERNSPFVFVYIRRLIVLYFIGAIHQILTRGDILSDYAMAGVLLLILHKLPRKFLPVLALLCFLIPWTRQLINGLKLESEKQSLISEKQSLINKKTITVDSSILDSYVGLYQFPNTQRIVTREGNNIFWGDLDGGHHDKLVVESETKFINPSSRSRISFVKDSSGNITSLNFQQNGVGNEISAQKLEINIDSARKNSSKKPSYKEFVVGNAQAFWSRLKNWSWKNYFWGFSINGILPLFLMGLYFGRRKIFYDISLNRSFLQKVMKWGLLIGLTSSVISLGFDAWNYFTDIKESYSFLTKHLMNAAWDFLGIMGLALGYIAGMALLLDKTEWKKRLSFLGPIGRMGLTNYLLQAVIISIIIDAYGFNLNGKAGPAWRLLMALITFAFITFISRWWFKHFRIGPAEWLWRSLTYLKFQPMRQKQTNDNSAIKETENL